MANDFVSRMGWNIHAGPRGLAQDKDYNRLAVYKLQGPGRRPTAVARLVLCVANALGGQDRACADFNDGRRWCIIAPEEPTAAHNSPPTRGLQWPPASKAGLTVALHASGCCHSSYIHACVLPGSTPFTATQPPRKSCPRSTDVTTCPHRAARTLLCILCILWLDG